ncbi:OmpH family outer membrane protein [Marinirhabdus gelatinilytica]|uniref:Periplasmic chaperone for outer membrane proteins Skp n=1 Tax=Marinirhabdus gelatinilytica TaxID=1703343 RepID=A0A370Q3R3_9FLAO|nr:OmpH family outer membrane protein [Marinirhabdus gelatinilytica]RDK83008.1 periplasmic chaperone for outer membrane proteins Skp [Marinirhabdus gelatinilytica]
MKHLKLIAIAIVLFVGTTSLTQAQSTIAHINTQELVEAMPEMKAAQSQLEKLKKTYDTQLKDMYKELETKAKQFDAEAATKTDEENAKRVEQVQGMQQNIQAFNQQAMQDLQKKEVDILQPILDKARQAIQKVARAQGIQYVYDSTPGGGLLLADGKDLLADVKKELGI